MRFPRELQVEAVVQEAKRDAKGVMPQYLRVDFLVDQQGWMTCGRPGRHVGLHLVVWLAMHLTLSQEFMTNSSGEHYALNPELSGRLFH